MIRRLCLLSREYPPDTAWGGIARAVETEARALAAAGVEVHVITLAPDGAERSYRDAGVEVHRIAEPRLADAPEDMSYVRIGMWSRAVSEKYWELDSAFGFDAVEAPDYHGEALHLYRRPETPLVIWLHTLLGIAWEGEGAELYGNERGWAGLELAALGSADVLIGTSDLILAETRRHLGERMPPARKIPYVFDPEDFPARRGSRRDGAPVRALFVGRIEPRKGVDRALMAVAAARRRGTDVRLTVIGRDDFGHRWELEELCASLGADGVQFLPEMDRDALVAHLNAADCALLPSRFESFHLAALEALSCGVPVITSDRTGVGSWFDRATGMARLPIDDAGEFAERAATLLADGGWLEHAGRAAASRVRELFDPAATGAQILELHEELQAGFRPGSAGHWPDGARAREMELHPLLDGRD